MPTWSARSVSIVTSSRLGRDGFRQSRYPAKEAARRTKAAAAARIIRPLGARRGAGGPDVARGAGASPARTAAGLLGFFRRFATLRSRPQPAEHRLRLRPLPAARQGQVSLEGRGRAVPVARLLEA